MSRLRFLDPTRNHWPAGTITPSSELAALPAVATQSPERFWPWRSASVATPHDLWIDLGAVRPVSCIAIANPRVVPGGGIEVAHGGDAGAPGAVVEVATVPAANPHTQIAFNFWATQNHRHWRVRFTNPTATPDYASAVFIHLGTYLEPAVNPSVPAQIPWHDPSTVAISAGGQRSVTRQPQYHTGVWKFRRVSDGQIDAMRAMFHEIGVGGNFFHVLDSDRGWLAWYAHQAGDLDETLDEVDGQYTIAMPWAEVR